MLGYPRSNTFDDSNQLNILLPKIFGESCQLFQDQDSSARAYFDYVSRPGLERPEVGWIYRSGGGLARLLRHAKTGEACIDSSRFMADLVLLCTPLSWKLSFRLRASTRILITPCASSSPVATLIATIVQSQLITLGVSADFVPSPPKSPADVQAKSILDWNQREGLLQRASCSVEPTRADATLVIIDDVLASGSTIRARARDFKVSSVIPVALTADLPGFRSRNSKLLFPIAERGLLI